MALIIRTLWCQLQPSGRRLYVAKDVATQWLHNNLGRPDIRIVDMRDSVTNYWQGHIPGAVYMHPEAMRLADQGVPVKLMPPEALVMHALGKWVLIRR